MKVKNVFVKPDEQTGARSRCAMARKCAIRWNVFVKPNEQNRARFNSVMARKGAIKWKLALPTVVREVKIQ